MAMVRHLQESINLLLLFGSNIILPKVYIMYMNDIAYRANCG